MITLQATMLNDVGLHARPAAVFVQQANKYRSRITIRNLSANGKPGNAKSILQVLALGVEQGHQVEVTAEGEDEGAAAETLKQLIDTDFAGYL